MHMYPHAHLQGGSPRDFCHVHLQKPTWLLSQAVPHLTPSWYFQLLLLQWNASSGSKQKSCPSYKKNSPVLFTAVGFQSISYPKEHILSFSSSGSCTFHPHSFPIDAQRLVLLHFTLKCYWDFFPNCGKLERYIGVPLCTSLLTTMGLWWAGYLNLLHLSARWIHPIAKCRAEPFSSETRPGGIKKESGSQSHDVLICCY